MHHPCMDLDSLILQLLDGAPITDQGDLQARLKAHGHELTQSTLSRRLKRLGVQKVQGRYRRVKLVAVLPERLAEVKAHLARVLAAR